MTPLCALSSQDSAFVEALNKMRLTGPLCPSPLTTLIEGGHLGKNRERRRSLLVKRCRDLNQYQVPIFPLDF